jgi:hypothetical protein
MEVRLYAILASVPDEMKINIPEFHWELSTGHTDIVSIT